VARPHRKTGALLLTRLIKTLASFSTRQRPEDPVALKSLAPESNTELLIAEPVPVEHPCVLHPNAEKIRGGLYGLLVGDALGVPYEFDRAQNIPAYELLEMEPPLGYQRSHRGVRPGTWSDDGAQALALLECLTRDRSLNLDEFAALLLRWFYEGNFTPDGRVFDVGSQTRRALESLRKGTPASQAGPASALENGNGALMRVLPVAFFELDAHQTEELAMRQAVVTHGHIRSRLCCAFYALVGSKLLNGASFSEALEFAELHLRGRWGSTAHADELCLILSGQNDVPRGSGYVVNSLWSAVFCVRTTDTYEAAVRTAIQLGDDTDTTACLAGGLAGIIYGVDAIPKRWMDTLSGKDMVEAAWRKFAEKT
jgi:ADP-ribosyl-[dinitrogen reductase] hydrolase